MRILFVADGRSPIARNWIGYFLEQGHEVHLASTFPAAPWEGLRSFNVLPVAFSGLKAAAAVSSGAVSRPASARRRGVGWRTRLRQWLGPVTLPAAARRLRSLIAALQPDLVHAMRIPYEGMLTALAAPPLPWLVSVWGNDFTLHARANPWMAWLTRRVLREAHALHTDCRRDARLALAWGYREGAPCLVAPGSGGIRREIFFPTEVLSEPLEPPVVINPRGVRAYVRTEVFFQAARLIARRLPRVQFVCPAMADEALAAYWVTKLGLQDAVQLLPILSPQEMAGWFRRAAVAVSPSLHDGTPNTLLEAMACGAFPVAGDIPSLREWITPGWNGLLFNPTDPNELAQAVLLALEQETLRQRARAWNQQLVAEHADFRQVMPRAEAFYQQLVEKTV